MIRLNQNEWFEYLQKIAEKVSSYPECKEFFEGIGEGVTYQYEVTDKPEYSFYQEYTGVKMIVYPGTIDNPTVKHIMKFDVIRGVFDGSVNPIDDTAKGNYSIEGNMAKLLKAAGLLPYIKKAHSEVS